MKTRALLVAVALSAGLLFSNGALACPCHPCKCSPCTCGGMGGKSSGGSGGDKHHGEHADHHGHHGHDGGSSVGVGVNVDLSGIGHRNAEADPFAVAGGGEKKPVAHTEEKRTSKHKEHEPTSSRFDDIKLTGQEAKDGNNPPSTFNVNNDETPPPESEQPKLPPTEVFTPKAPADAAGDLKKAHDDYHKACSDWLKKQPNWNQLVHDWTNSPNTEEGNKKSSKAYKKVLQLMDQFNAGDGKQLVDDWKKTFDNALKSGATVDDNSMIPPPQNDIEKKKYAVLKAQNDLKWAQKNYDDIRHNAANRDEQVTKAQKALDDLGAVKPDDPKYKAAVADINKAVNEAGQKWAGTDEGKKEIQKVHDAEKELEKAKEAWKPFEKYVEK